MIVSSKIHQLSSQISFFLLLLFNWDQHGKLKQEFLFLFQHEEVAMPYVQLLADFREQVRNVARDEKGETKN